MSLLRPAAVAATLFLAPAIATAQKQAPTKEPSATAAARSRPVPGVPDITYTRFVLGNGLTVLVHEDHKAPIVAVNLWYHVGRRTRSEGKTGFAHLFEHLMFAGSENHNDRYIPAAEALGATDLNGTTNDDRTNYFETVPVIALDRTLLLESDRHGPSARRDRSASGSTCSAASCRTRSARARTSSVWQTRQHAPRANTFPAGHPYSSLEVDRLHGRSRRRIAQRREGLVPAPTTARQRHAVHRRRHHARRSRAGKGREVLRRHPVGPADDAAEHRGSRR